MNLPSLNARRGRLTLIASAAIAAVFVVVASKPPPEHDDELATEPDVRGDFASAPTHLTLAEGRSSVNRMRHGQNLVNLAPGRVDVRLEPHDEATWQTAVARRAERRAYDGAPPVIPHPVDQRGMPSCSTCHDVGAHVTGSTASPMSHELLTSCTQCHVVASSPLPVADEQPHMPPIDNGFQGLASAGKGSRAGPHAPPVIPHSTWMRQRCTSCHGGLSQGLHTTHIERQSCTQCHAPSAVLDQQAWMVAP